MKKTHILRQNGATLLELLGVLSILSLAFTIGGVHLASIQKSFRNGSIKQLIRDDLLLAESKSIAERARVIFRETPNGYQVGFDYPPYSGTGQIDTVSPLDIRRTVSSEVKISIEPLGRIIFDSRGNVIDGTTGDRTTGLIRVTSSDKPLLSEIVG
jgi:Tfp pilus assembly protein FimT